MSRPKNRMPSTATPSTSRLEVTGPQERGAARSPHVEVGSGPNEF